MGECFLGKLNLGKEARSLLFKKNSERCGGGVQCEASCRCPKHKTKDLIVGYLKPSLLLCFPRYSWPFEAGFLLSQFKIPPFGYLCVLSTGKRCAPFGVILVLINSLALVNPIKGAGNVLS